MASPVRPGFAAAIAVVAAALFTFRPTYDPDLFWHLAQGRHDIEQGLVRANVFSAVYADYPQHYTSYLFEVVQAVAARSLGLAGVQVFQWAGIVAALMLLYAAARTRGGWAASMAVLLLALFVIEPRAMPRPYVISFVGLAFCAWWIARASPAVGRWPLVVAIGVWSHFHSESVFGVAFVVLSTLETGTWAERLKLWTLCALATLATPYGVGLWRYLAENAGVPSALRIAELEPATFAAYPAFYAFLAVLFVAMASMPRRLRLVEVAVTVVFAGLGVRFIRFTPMVVFVAAPILADRIQAWIERGWDRRAVLVTAVAVMAVTAPASPRRMLAAWRTGDAALAPPEYFSADALSFVRAHHLESPMFNSMNLGGWLDWELGRNTFVDSRLQAAPRDLFVALTTATADPAAWRALVARCDWAMLSLARPTDISGVGKFDRAEWATVFRDRAAEILVRREGRYADLARRLDIIGG